MSLRGQLNKVNQDFFNAIRGAAMRGNTDSEGGFYGTRKIAGYVCKVHSINDENKELCGTVDVQEYGYEPGEDKIEGAGYHEGVLCSALQTNKNGMYVMPALFSDVMIVQDPVNMTEYVVMCSHVDDIQLQSRSNVKLGVVETEEFQESTNDDDDTPDMDDLAQTGNAAYTSYTKDNIIHTVKNEKGEITISQSAEQVVITAKDTVIKVNTDGRVEMTAKNVELTGTSALKTSSPHTIIDGEKVEVTGSSFVRYGKSNVDGRGGFCGIPVCPFTGAIHTGSIITGG